MIQRSHGVFVREFPSELPKKATIGALVTLSIQLYYGRPVEIVLYGAAVAAVASVVEATTRPIFAEILPQNPIARAYIAILISEVVFTALATRVAPLMHFRYQVSHPLLTIIPWLILNENIICKKEAVAVIL